ncbi:DUF7679 family protein [Enterococcus cecorum]|uniref:DUF7679 family protein n=1 Tax=Enterococcus cecorum TaxID=44008 RepID=UPI00148BF002|nr:hypothetical protein [Enterococcus cecorum]
MNKRKKKICVKIQWLDGREQLFKLPNDLQEPMYSYKEKNPYLWKDLLKGGLINIPTKKYQKKKQPPMTVVRILDVFIAKRFPKKTTRGQFLIQENWQQISIRHFIQNYRFLRHDYPRLTQLRILIAYFRWYVRLVIERKKGGFYDLF